MEEVVSEEEAISITGIEVKGLTLQTRGKLEASPDQEAEARVVTGVQNALL